MHRLAKWSSARGPCDEFHGVDRNVGPPDTWRIRVADGEKIEQDALRVLQNELRFPLRIEICQFLDPENRPHPTSGAPTTVLKGLRLGTME
jgi:hypothetical protein